jgi:hypothetical protein
VGSVGLRWGYTCVLVISVTASYVCTVRFPEININAYSHYVGERDHIHSKRLLLSSLFPSHFHLSIISHNMDGGLRRRSHVGETDDIQRASSFRNGSVAAQGKQKLKTANNNALTGASALTARQSLLPCGMLEA